jgi:hypothetical protein
MESFEFKLLDNEHYLNNNIPGKIYIINGKKYHELSYEFNFLKISIGSTILKTEEEK